MKNRSMHASAAIGAALLALSCSGGDGAPEKRWEGVKLIASDGAAGDWFGSAVAASGDGNIVVIGAPDASAGRGAVYVDRRNGSSWAETKLTASDGVEGDIFGRAVAVSADGNTIAVGASQYESGRGAAYVLAWDGAGWSETKLLETDVPLAGASYAFGSSVSLSADGGALAVGSSQGDTYVFVKSGTTWSGVKVAVATGDGAAVISSDADTLVQGWSSLAAAGVYRNDGAGWRETILAPSGGQASDEFGSSISTFSGGDGVAVGAYDSVSSTPGAVYVYRWSGAAWTEEKLVSSDGQPGDGYGYSVSASADGTVLAVGAGGADRVYLHKRSGGAWSEEKLAPTDGAGTWFGESVAAAADGDTVAVGAPRDASNRGAVYVYTYR